MSKQKGRVRIETSQRPSQTYDVGGNEEITVRTRREEPEVTGGSGGGNNSGGCLGGIIVILLISTILLFAYAQIFVLVETIIEEINPNYITTHEKAEEKRLKEKNNAKKEEKKTQINQRNSVEHSWDTSGLKPHTGESAKLHWWLEDELKGNDLAKKFENLAGTICKQTNGFNSCIYDYSQKGQNLWVAGNYSGVGKDGSDKNGFICHSPDSGKNWVRQWCSKNGESEPIYGIYFSNSNEGWALTLKEIIYTTDSGTSWNRMLRSEYGPENLFVLSKNNLIVTETLPIYFYYSENGGLTWSKIKITPEYEQKLGDLKKSFNGRAMHYGGIYSKE